MRCALMGVPKRAALVLDENESLIESLEGIGARDVLARFKHSVQGL